MTQITENCIVLTPKSVLMNIKKCKQNKVSLNAHGLNIECSFNSTIYPSIILTRVEDKQPQQITLVWQAITFGQTAYFKCSCGNRCRRLYLPPGCIKFKCRTCYHLRYELSLINRNTVQGRFLYRFNRILKLTNQRASMNRIFYKNCYTKRFERFLDLCSKAGLNNIVNDARDLMNSIKSQSI